jgi:hypothetical protein
LHKTLSFKRESRAQPQPALFAKAFELARISCFLFRFFSNFKARAASLRKQRQAIPVTVQGNRPKVERVVLNALAEHMRFSP